MTGIRKQAPGKEHRPCEKKALRSEKVAKIYLDYVSLAEADVANFSSLVSRFQENATS